MSRPLGASCLVFLLALAPAAAASAAAPHLRSDASTVVVPRGQTLQLALVDEPAGGLGPSIANAVQMAVRAHPLVRGFRIQVNTFSTQTCGDPPGTVTLATATASAVVANLQNAAVLGQVCSFGFASALTIYQRAGVATITGSATNPALPTFGATVFDRTIPDGATVDSWYATVTALPSDVAWQQAYASRFGAAPGRYADLYYDAATLLVRDLRHVSRVDARHDLVIDRAALARAVRATVDYRGVSCTITLDPATGNRVDDRDALARCAAGG
jgi:ABC-type branched-subunit amino acid transport system substrate-binding protein